MRGPQGTALEAKTQLATAESQTPQVPSCLPHLGTHPFSSYTPFSAWKPYLPPPNAQTLSSFPSQPVVQVLPTSLPNPSDHEDGLQPLSIQSTVSARLSL